MSSARSRSPLWLPDISAMISGWCSGPTGTWPKLIVCDALTFSVSLRLAPVVLVQADRENRDLPAIGEPDLRLPLDEPEPPVHLSYDGVVLEHLTAQLVQAQLVERVAGRLFHDP